MPTSSSSPALSFNEQIAQAFNDFQTFMAGVGTALQQGLLIAEADLPKVQEVLSVVAALTSLIPGGPAPFIQLAANTVGVVDTYVKTTAGVAMAASEAAAIGAPVSAPLTGMEKHAQAVKIMTQAYPTVDPNTIAMHVRLAYTKVKQIDAAKKA